MFTIPDFTRADQAITQGLRENAFTAACLLVGQNERILHRRAFGRLSMDDDSPMTNEQTRFDLASITKPLVTGMLSLRALEAGKLCLTDRLDTFFDAPADKAGITIEQLLTHTAGFGGGLHLWESGRDAQDAADLILALPLTSAPGARVMYGCAGFILLGQLLECLYGLELSELATQEVFWPLKMRRTGYLPQDGNIAATEMQDDGRCLQGVVHDDNARFLGGVSGNGGVFSTMDDLALFLQMLAAEGALPGGGRYLCPSTVRAALQNRTPGMAQGRGLAFHLPSFDRGYTGDLFPKETVGHTGFTGCSITLDPTTGLYVVLLTNRVCPSRESSGIYRIRRLVHNAVYAACGL